MNNGMLIASSIDKDVTLFTWDSEKLKGADLTREIYSHITNHFSKVVGDFKKNEGEEFLCQNYMVEYRPEEYDSAYNDEDDTPLNDIRMSVTMSYSKKDKIFMGEVDYSSTGSWKDLKLIKNSVESNVEINNLDTIFSNMLQAMKGIDF